MFSVFFTSNWNVFILFNCCNVSWSFSQVGEKCSLMFYRLSSFFFLFFFNCIAGTTLCRSPVYPSSAAVSSLHEEIKK